LFMVSCLTWASPLFSSTAVAEVSASSMMPL
jgi:hypothetical protein